MNKVIMMLLVAGMLLTNGTCAMAGGSIAEQENPPTPGSSGEQNMLDIGEFFLIRENGHITGYGEEYLSISVDGGNSFLPLHVVSGVVDTENIECPIDGAVDIIITATDDANNVYKPIKMTLNGSREQVRSVKPGWQMVSFSFCQYGTFYNMIGLVSSIWLWEGQTWGVFVPDAPGYGKEKGFNNLESYFLPGRGYWVNWKKAAILHF